MMNTAPSRGLNNAIEDSVLCIPDAISEINNQNSELKIYPNPAQQYFIVELPKEQNFSLLVYDVTGQKVYENKNAIGTVKVDCSNFSNGIYFVRAVNQRTVLTGKMIKE